MGIPKVIHYCWFGGNPLPEKVKQCIESWKKYCPEYEIIEWNEDNYDVHKIRYMDEAYRSGKWAFVTDYARLDIVFSHGGIYLDTDVELVKSPDELLKEEVFLAMEKPEWYIATGLGFGAEQGCPLLWELMELYHKIPFILEDGSFNRKPCPQYTTEYLLEKGYVMEDRTQRIGNAVILASEYFCPKDYYTGIFSATEHTIGIHWYEASWYNNEEKELRNIQQKIRRYLPAFVSERVCFICRKTYRLIVYTRKGILLEKIKSKLKRRA